MCGERALVCPRKTCETPAASPPKEGSTVALLLLTSSADAAGKKVIRLWQTETEPQTMAVLNRIAAEEQGDSGTTTMRENKRTRLQARRWQ
jgi:hypothetical protein